MHKVVIPALWAPAIAFAAAFALLARDLLGLPVADARRREPLVPARPARSRGTWVGFTHGANDAQKTMGVIALALYAEGTIDTSTSRPG